MPACLNCAADLHKPARGPLPRYCSATCKARASDNRAKSDGRYGEWYENTLANKRQPTITCPFCGTDMPSGRKQCGSEACHKQYNRDRMRSYFRAKGGNPNRTYYDKACEVCGTEFRTAAKAGRYCSQPCQYEGTWPGYTERRTLSASTEIVPFEGDPWRASHACPICSESYYPKTAAQRFCSKRCNETSLRRQRTKSNREFIDCVKSAPCMDCGRTYPPYVMDLDHVRGEKTANVSKLMGKPFQTLYDEVMKCDLVCANCHRVRTATRAGW